MQQRRRLKHSFTFQERLAQEAARAKLEADTLPTGAQRDLMLKKARQAETALQMTQWLSSPGLRPPR